jgi:hypothetical protein
VRLVDETFFRLPLTDDRIGARFYFKFLAWNAYGGGLQSLADVPSYPYIVTGVALTEALAPPTELRMVYSASLATLYWAEIADFRHVLYEVRKGASWAGAQVLGRYAHPPFVVFGDDTYWVASYANPSPGIVIYSTPVSIAVTTSAILGTVTGTHNEGSTGWSGTVGGGAAVSGSVVETTDTGSGQVSGTYQIPSGHIINAGSVASRLVVVDWRAFGASTAANVLTVTDWLSVTDVLSQAGSQNTDVHPEISLSQDGTTWGPWVKYAPGAYLAWAYNLRMQILTSDPQTQAVLSSLVFTVGLP